MIQFIAGGKGEGKTKKLIDMANAAAKTTDGHIVFIDDDKRHIYDLHYDIRFVETGSFNLANYREFIGFIYGVLSQDHDIVDIFVDGLTNVIEKLDNEALIKLVTKLKEVAQNWNVKFIISMNCKIAELPEEIKEMCI